jgi:hypothetical protein
MANRKTHQLSVKVTPEKHAEIQNQAMVDKRPLADWIRIVIDEKLDSRKNSI